VQTLINDAERLLRQGLEHHRHGRWSQAEPLYREVLALDPAQPEALHLLGVLKNQNGDPAAAAALIRQAIQHVPGRVEYYNSLGNALRAQGDLRAAAASFERALALNPRSVEVLTNLGSLMEQAGNLEDATLCYLRALELNPGYADAHYTLANLLKKVGNFTEAVAHYEQAIAPGAEYAAEALNNLGTALRRLGRPEEAAQRFRQAIAQQAPFFEAHLNLADSLEEAGRLEEAARMYQAILGFRPDSAIAYSGAAGIFQDQGRPERATAAYRKAVELAPDNPVLHSNLLLHLHYDPTPAPADLLAAHQEWDERHARRLSAGRRSGHRKRDPEKPLRIGFVSADLRIHPVGFFLSSVLASQRREGFQFICYSDVTAPDAMTARLQAGADLWRDTFTTGDQALSDQVRQDEIDVLVDLAGHTRGNRLCVFARKPAPVQVTWAGYPDTTGISQMDYLLSDRWQTPEGAERWFVEKVVRVPDGYICYRPPEDAPPVAPLPAQANGFITFGSFNRLAKINPDVVRLWSRLLRESPQSRLILRARGLADETVARRYHKMFSREGVERSRVDLVGPGSHLDLLAAYATIDIALDPFPYSGGLTTCEALWMGVPVITLAGERMASRHSTSHLSNVGLPEWVAATPEQYLALALDFAQDLDRLRSLRSGVRDRMAASPLVDGERFTANLLSTLRRLARASAA
jgi:predicted O-linked N-acetylglucosamine transferase (SPINDLY family)